MKDVASIQQWLCSAVARELDTDEQAVDVTLPWNSYGLDSVKAIALLAELGRILERRLPVVLMWECPNIAALARRIADGQQSESWAAPVGAATGEPIAVVGLACRFPRASDPDAFWGVLRDGVDTVTEIPAARATPALVTDDVVNRAALLEDVAGFDPAFFGISRAEAAAMDPQQRLVLELAWEALENAGIPPAQLAGTRTGVFVGVIWHDYADLQLQLASAPSAFSSTGAALNVVAGRVSYALDLRGPSMVVDTACSSSLVAVHLACQSLRSGESQAALVGGINLLLSTTTLQQLWQFGGLSPVGQCRSFDADAAGFVRGEGGAMVVLKPLSRAVADGDQIRALIRGSAVNQDGRSNGLTAPNPLAQAAVLREAYAVAGVEPESVAYVETHGTGTRLGDPIEASALGMVFATRRAADAPLRIGSVKTNIGHAEGAAGIAGFIKVVLSLQHRALAPNLHFDRPNPDIPFDGLRLRVQRELEAWPEGAELLAGVSSFGWSGTNCHIVLQGVSVERAHSPELRAVQSVDADTEVTERKRVVLVYSPQGGQWSGMAREMLRWPSFRRAVAAADAELEPLLGWSVMQGLYGIGRLDLDRAEVAQPLIFAVQVGLTALWTDAGVEPDAIIGHSMGEFAAAWAAGVLSLRDACRVVVHASRAQGATASDTGMGLVGLSAGELTGWLSDFPELVFAGENSLRSANVSGPASAIDALVARAQREGVFAVRIAVDVAAHGPRMEAVRAPLARALRDIAPGAPRCRLQSTVTGRALDRAMDSEYWSDLLTQPVLFRQAIAEVAGLGASVLMEIGPSDAVARAMQECALEAGAEHDVHDVIAAPGRSEAFDDYIARTLECLGRAGVDVCRREVAAREVLPFVLSAKSEPALRAQASRLLEYLTQTQPQLRDVAHTLALGRTQFERRAAVVADSRDALLEGLAALARGDVLGSTGIVCGRADVSGKVAFVFPGQGAQWAGMASSLLESSGVFRAQIEACAQAFAPHTDWSLLDVLLQRPGAASLERVDVVQPALFAVMVSLAALWRSLGVEPDAVVGHSQGEIAAAFVAGALTLEDASRVVVLRSQALRALAGRGGMLAVELAAADVEGRMASYSERLSLAAINGPRSSVVSGEPEALQALHQELTAAGASARMIRVDYASHSAQVEQLRAELRARLGPIAPQRAQLPMYSSVRGAQGRLERLEGPELDGEYWYRNLRETVCFGPAVSALVQDGHRFFVEVSPHPVLALALEQTLEQTNAVACGSLRRDDGGMGRLMQSFAQLLTRGLAFDARASWSGGERVALPTYAFARERFWRAPMAEWADIRAAGLTDPSHPLLAATIPVADADRVLFSGRFASMEHRWLSGHVVFGQTIVPGTVFVELALAAAERIGGLQVEELLLHEPLVLPQLADAVFQVAVDADDEGGRRAFTVHARPQDAESQSAWIQHASGTLAPTGRMPSWHAYAWPPPESSALALDAFEQRLSVAGVEDSLEFAGLVAAYRLGREWFAEVELPVGLAHEADQYCVHPLLLSAALRVLALDVREGQPPQTPFSFENVSLCARAGRSLRVRLSPGEREASWNIAFADPCGAAVGEVAALSTRPLSAAQLERTRGSQTRRGALYRVDWVELGHASREANALRWAVVAPSELAFEPPAGSLARYADFAALSAALDAGERAPDAIAITWSSQAQPALLDSIHAAARRDLQLLKAYLADPRLSSSQLILFTCRSLATGVDDPVLDASHAPRWGLVRAAQAEHPERAIRLVDLDRDAALPASLWTALASDEPQLAVRAGATFAARLAVAPASTARAALGTQRIDPEGTVLITGGTGPLGAVIARHLVHAHGVKHLLLVSRRGPEAPEAEALVAELGQASADASVVRCDVSDREAVRALLETIPAEHPLRGVVHTAAVLADGALGALESAQLDAAMRPKLDAAFHLHELTQSETLQMFVLYSSMAGTLGGAGQASYAAANACLDALASVRRGQGKPAHALAWGVWGDAGMFTRLPGASRAHLRRRGVAPMSNSEALALFDAALSRAEPSLLPARLDLAALDQTEGVPHLLRGLVRMRLPKAAAAGTPAAPFTRRLSAARGADRARLWLDLVLSQTASLLGHPGAASVEPDAGFLDQGLDSVVALLGRRQLQHATGLTLSATLAFDHSTPRRVAKFLDEQFARQHAVSPERAVAEVAAPTFAAPYASAPSAEPIAIVGIGLRLPGGVMDLETAFHLLSEGGDVVGPVPPERWDEAIYDPDPEAVGKSYVRAGAFLDHVDRFDADFFGISPREAERIDPQHRLLLEATWHALEDAGIVPSSLADSATGVFVGIGRSEYELRRSERVHNADAYDALGTQGSFAAGRLAFTLGLQGPTFALDTGCSSSLVALHQAVQALRSGACELALAAGVHVIAAPQSFALLSRLRALAPDGRSKTFSAHADGFGRGEGVVVLVLARHGEARAQGRRVLALVRGSAINHDGQSSGITVPNGSAQQKVLRAALEDARVAAADVDVVECHGTGTALGDPIEVQALSAVYGVGRSPERPLWLGAVKTNFGHLEAAAGLAGVAKLIAALRWDAMPPTLHTEPRNPHIDWDTLPVRVVDRALPWPAHADGKPRTAGVSAFGMSGTNAHVILEEAPRPLADESSRVAGRAMEGWPVLVSAKSEAALRAQLSQLAQHLAAHPELRVCDVALSLAAHRTHFPLRAYVFARELPELIERLKAVTGSDRAGELARVAPKSAWLLSGQGSQRGGYGAELHRRHPVFARVLDQVAARLDPKLPRPLLEVMFAAPGSPDARLLDQTLYTQCSVFAVSIAIGRLFESWGVQPDLLLGHSVGEVAAAHLAGVLSLEDACRLIGARAAAMQSLPAGGGMLALACSRTELEALLHSDPERLSLAAENAPRSFVVSGELSAIEAVAQRAAALGCKATRLRTSHAFHSPHMRPALEPLRAVARELEYRPARIPIVSNLTGQLATDEQLCSSDYWVSLVEQPVLFHAGIRTLLAHGVECLLELGAQSQLSALAAECVPAARQSEPAIIAVQRKEQSELEGLGNALGRLHGTGIEVDWSTVFRESGAEQVRLPNYPFQRERFWIGAGNNSRRQRGLGELGQSAVFRPYAPAPAAAAREPRSWLLIAPEAGVATWVDELAQALAQLGVGVRLCRLDVNLPCELAAAWFEARVRAELDASAGWGVLSLLALDERSAAGAAPLPRGLFLNLALAQALERLTFDVPLWISTREAVSLQPTERGNPGQAMSWGLGRVIGLESPSRFGGLIDLPCEIDAALAERLVCVLTADEHEDQLALRASGSFRRRIVAFPEPKPYRRFVARGTALITGGTGALGSHVARWLARGGAERIVLASRRGSDAPGALALADELRARVPEVRLVACDCGDREALAALLDEIASNGPPLRAVFHTAGIAQYAPLSEVSAAELTRVARDKVAGALYLHELLGDQPLDVFALFSSVAATWGSGGQSAYAAANAYLDALVELRRTLGLAATSIAWGPWAGGGMVDALNGREELARRGLFALTPERALAALDAALASDAGVVSVADVDWNRFVIGFAAARPRPLLDEMVELTSTGLAMPETSERRAPGTAASLAELLQLVLQQTAAVLGRSESRIDPDQGFFDLGLDSLMVVELRSQLRRATGCALPATLAFDQPSPGHVARYLHQQLSSANSAAPLSSSAAQSLSGPLAITGIGLRLPGGATDLDRLWTLLADEVDTARTIPGDRWDHAALYDPDPERPGSCYVREACVLDGVADFDADFFGISPREATSMDPQQRLLLETAWQALEHASIVPAALRETRVGVFVGAGPSEYERLLSESADADAHTLTGNLAAFAAGRLAFTLGLQGPALSVDTACSSSLVALHLAGQALRRGECRLALVGGVQLMASGAAFVNLSRTRALARDGRSKTFSERADGYGRGEGAIVLVLERAPDAEAQGRRVLALVSGSAVNHDGPSSSITAPNGTSQQLVLRAALADAGLTPADIDVVECHGTGTALGDPIEVEALNAVYGAGRASDRPLRIGTIKSNIGHLEPAAGLAGIAKLIVMFRARAVPASLHSEPPNPHLDWDRLSVRVVRALEPWQSRESGVPRRAAVSAFGLSGTNAHVILEEPASRVVPSKTCEAAEDGWPIVISAKSEAALHAQVAQLREFVRAHPESRVCDVAFTLATARSHFSERVAVFARDVAELTARLDPPEERLLRGRARSVPRQAWLFSGQGSQRAESGKQLYQRHPVFARSLDEIAGLLNAQLEVPLLEVMFAEPASEPAILLDQTLYAQCALFGFEVALYRLLESFRLQPDLLLGHSVGELAVAHVAGVWSLSDACKLLGARARAMQSLPRHGGMLSVACARPELDALLANEPQLWLAASNAPRAFVLSGELTALERVRQRCVELGYKATRLRTSHAFHSGFMQPIADALRAVARELEYRPAQIAIASSVTGRLATDAELGDPDYWVASVVQPVLFHEAVRTAFEQDAPLMLELGPDGQLSALAREIAADGGIGATIVPTSRKQRSELETLGTAVAQLHCAGVNVDWSSLFRDSGARTVELPSYQFQRARYWIDAVTARKSRATSTSGFALAGERVDMPDGSVLHRIEVGPGVQSYLQDHVVYGRITIAGAFQLSVLIAVAQAHWSAEPFELRDVQFLQALTFAAADERQTLHVQLSPLSPSGYAARVSTRRGDVWTQHLTATLAPLPVPAPVPTRAAFPAKDRSAMMPQSLLNALHASNVDWGSRWWWHREGGQCGRHLALTRMEPPDGVSLSDSPLPGGLIDNAFGLEVWCGDSDEISSSPSRLPPDPAIPRLPFGVERLVFYGRPATECWVQYRVTKDTPESTYADIEFWSADGTLIARLSNFTNRHAPSERFLSLVDPSQRHLYEVGWSEVGLSARRHERNETPREVAWWGTPPREWGAVLPGRELASVEALCHAAPSSLVLALPAPGDDPAQDARSSVHEVLALLRLLLSHPRLARTRLAVLTQQALALQPSAATPGFAQSAVWGLLRSASIEQPQRAFTLIDLDDHAESLRAVPAALESGEPQLALRAGKLLVPRIVRAGGVSSERRSLDPEGTILITGGTGGLGSLVARHLASAHGARQLLLISRKGVESPGAPELRAELRALGANVRIEACDASDRACLAQLLDSVDPAHPLHAVIHCAGVLDDGLIESLTPERIERVFVPKIDAALALDALTRDRPLAAFVLLSSISGVVGAAGQASYAAANAFVDALATRRRAAGLPGLSIAYGPWAEAGMAARLSAGDRARMQRLGVPPLSSADGLALFDAVLGRSEAQLVAAQFDLAALAAREGDVPAVLRTLARRTTARAQSASAGDLQKRLRRAAAGERERLLTELVHGEIARVFGLASASAVDPERPLQELGLDSLLAVELRDRLASRTGWRLPATLLFDHPTPASLVKLLGGELLGAALTSGAAESDAPVAARPEPGPHDAVAIVAMSCRFPGGVATPEAFWDLIVREADAIGPFPTDRGWPLDSLYDPDPAAVGKTSARTGGFLRDVAQFDPAFFGISPREAHTMDPQHRMLLETTWEAVERAQIVPADLSGSRTGVWVGMNWDDYQLLTPRAEESVDGLPAFATALAVASGRISYTLGLQGPAMTVDTACSSSLVAIHLACQALRNGECTLALASGVSIFTTPAPIIVFSRMRTLSPDGRCRAFSDDAAGAGWAEGVGTLLLERLEDAERNGRPVLALIRGSAVNQDGRSQGLTAPNGPAQERVIQQALAAAGVRAADVQVVEAHGTATKLGDPIEAQALIATYGKAHTPEEPLWLGTIKSNIGHAQSAAGMAGVIKMVLALQHELLPRSLHAQTPTRHVDWSSGTVQLLARAREWPRSDRPRRAGVSSFGLSGTNAHLVLEEPPLIAAAPSARDLATSGRAEVIGTLPLLFAISGKSPEALRGQAAALHEHCASDSALDLPGLARALATTRTHFERRAVVLAEDRASLLRSLSLLADAKPAARSVEGQAQPPSKLVFVFPGQGSQWPGMARELYVSSRVFQRELDACAQAFAPFVDWDLIATLRGEDNAASFERVDVVQPALFSMMVALAALWRGFGVQPDAVIGHSQGEIAAAYVAGVLNLADAARVVALRSQCLARELAGRGAMMVVELERELLAPRLAPYGDRVSIAAEQSSRSVIVSGELDALDSLERELVGDGLFARKVRVDYASHTPQVELVRERLLRELAALEPQSAQIALYSTLHGARIDGREMDASYWYRNLREPVRFRAAIQAALHDGHAFCVEISSHPVLSLALQENARDAETTLASVSSLRRGEGQLQRILLSAGELHTRGFALDWDAWLPPAANVALPTYAFQRQRYWLEPGAQRRGDIAYTGLRSGAHPWLPASLSLAERGASVFTGQLSLAAQPWLGGHRVFGTTVMPATGLLELALAAAQRAGAQCLEELTIESPLLLSSQAPVQVQVLLGGPEPSGSRTLAIHSRRTTGADANEQPWTRNASGSFVADEPGTLLGLRDWPPPNSERVALDDLYERLERAGIGYSEDFRALRRAYRRGGELFAELQLPAVQREQAEQYALHPVLLDAALQLMASERLGHRAGESLELPFAFTDVRLTATGADALRVRISPADRPGTWALDITDAEGEPIAAVGSLASRPVSPERLQAAFALGDALYRLDWVGVTGPSAATRSQGRWLWLPDDDAAAELRRTAAAVQAGSEAPEVCIAAFRPHSDDSPQRAAERALAVLQAFLAEPGFGACRLVFATWRAVATAPEDTVLDLVHSPVWGLIRAAQVEHRDLDICLLDLDEGVHVERALGLAIAVLADEHQLAVRMSAGALRLSAPRLVHASTTEPAHAELTPPSGARNWRLERVQLGTLDGLALTPHPEAERPLGAGQVRVAVRAAAIDASDVRTALDPAADEHARWGSEGAGVVVELGTGVSRFTLGERVFGLLPGAFGTLAIADARTIAPLPKDWSFAEGAGSAVALLATLLEECHAEQVPDPRQRPPEVIAALFEELLPRIQTGALRPVRVELFDVRRARQAFLRLARGESIGRIALGIPQPLASDGTLLISGIGMLGRAVARQLVAQHGVTRLLLVSRQGESMPGAREFVDELRELGASAKFAACDCADRAQLARLLESTPPQHPLTGVVHTAGTPEGGPLYSLTADSLASSLRPKIDAAINLHELTAPLDPALFVVFSSVIGTFGGFGQGGYAAGNAFLDALAQRRRSEGLSGLSLAWGYWGERSAMTAHVDAADVANLLKQGIGALSLEQGMALFEESLRRALPSLLPVNLQTAQLSVDGVPPILRRLVRAAPRRVQRSARANASALKETLAPLSADAQVAHVLELVREQVAIVLGSEAERVESDRPLLEFGLDSLMAVELRNRLNVQTGLRMPATLLFDHPTAIGVAQLIASKLRPERPAPAGDPAALIEQIERALLSLEEDAPERQSVTQSLQRLVAKWAQPSASAQRAPDAAQLLAAASDDQLLEWIEQKIGGSGVAHEE